MEKEQIEFKLLEAKLVGSDTVVFRLEDGAMVKVRVGIGRAGVPPISRIRMGRRITTLMRICGFKWFRSPRNSMYPNLN